MAGIFECMDQDQEGGLHMTSCATPHRYERPRSAHWLVDLAARCIGRYFTVTLTQKL